MRIGLIGGIGPAATVTYYRELVRLYAEADRELPLTIVNAEVRTMTGNLATGRRVEQAGIFARLIDRLRGGGCEVAALTSMGGHFCFDELEARSSLPLVSAISSLEAHFAAGRHRRVGVLGTRTVMESRLYGVRSVEVVAPDGEDLDRVNDAYVAVATAGAASPAQRGCFHRVGRWLVEERSVEAVVLGGTDLSVAFDGDAGFLVVDSALVHARAIAAAAMG